MVHKMNGNAKITIPATQDGFEEISLSNSRKNTTTNNGRKLSEVKIQDFTKMDKKKYIVITVLFFVNLLNYMDRFTIAGVLTDIQEFYNINDASAGYLHTVFLITFLIFAPAFGYIGDRYNRKAIMVFGLSVWVVAVLASAFIPKNMFWLFVALRGIVGIGEASYVTVAPTLIADLSIGDLRSKILMVFYFAIPIGCGFGYIAASVVSSMTGSWQWGVGFLPTIFGVICILTLIFYVSEPERGQAEASHLAPKQNGTHEDTNGTITSPTTQANAIEQHKPTSWIEDLKYFAKNRTYVWSIVAYTAVLFVVGTLSFWAPTIIENAQAKRLYLKNTSALDKTVKSNISLSYGAITMFAGIAGVAIGSITSYAWKNGRYCFARFRNERADALISAIGSFLAFPFLFASFYLIDINIILSWISIFLTVFFLCLNWAIYVDMLMDIIVPQRRSLANSLQVSISHLFGDAAGPAIIGHISDWFRGEDTSPAARFDSLVKSFYLPILLLLISGIAFTICAYTLKRDMLIMKRDIGHITGTTSRITPLELDFEKLSYSPKTQKMELNSQSNKKTHSTNMPRVD